MAHPLRDKAAVSGIGETAYTRGTPKSGLALQLEASLAAIADAGLSPTRHRRRRALRPGRRRRRGFRRQLRHSRSHASRRPRPWAAPARVAAIQMRDGRGRDRRLQARADLARPHRLLRRRVGTRVQQIPQFRAGRRVRGADRRVRAGAALRADGAPAHGALRHHRRGSSPRSPWRRASTPSLNGNAMMSKPITVEDHQASRMIADPLRLLDCSLESDGGAAVVVSAADRARDLEQPPVNVMGVAEGHPDSPSAIAQRPDLTTFGLAKAAPRAFAMAGRRARRHRRRRDLRLLHLHRDLPARGPRASAGRARAGRSSRTARIGAGRPAADQHPWRAAVARRTWRA